MVAAGGSHPPFYLTILYSPAQSTRRLCPFILNLSSQISPPFVPNSVHQLKAFLLSPLLLLQGLSPSQLSVTCVSNGSSLPTGQT